MNTSEDGTQMAPGAPANGASNSTNKPATRRRRAPNRRTKAENATAPAEMRTETQPEAAAEAHTEPQVEPAPAAASEAQPAANGATNGATEAPGEQAERKTTRPRRARNTKSRRPAVELVRPPTAESSETADETAAPVESAVDVADEAAAEPQEASAEGAPTRRYRFQRPARATTQSSAAPAVRPERLSGRMAQPTPVEAEPAPEATASAEPEEESLESLLAGLGTADTASIGEPIVIEEDAPAEPPLLEPEVEPLAEDKAETAEAGEAPEEHEEGTATRRRRRRRRTSPHTSEPEGEESAEQPTTRTGGLSVVDFGAAPPAERRQSGFQMQPTETPYTPLSAPYTPGGMPGARDRGARRTSTQPPAWNTGDAPQEIGEPDSPYVSPEPAYPRGFGPQPRGVAGPVREPYTPRTGQRGAETPISTNQLANVLNGAIQQQTDRLLTELRRQAPPANMTIAMPPFPSTERVGVFVDVANIVYSSRNLRVHVDFGRLLDFLRGNRRMIRAHAYAPTSPEPQANQEFLSPVKGVGYRITTKNYKTFSSGAKKADLDLDLCMDIVRLVDSGAVETVVLVSGDSDFLPLLEYCSDKGVRVEVAAFDDSAAAILRQSCDLFINLSLVDDILL
ncbi:MAG TPA: NYN domain-containing protein [Ktedonobacterales bacterium]|jgi:uncharacterized LabA/DUF88 family protein